MAAAAERGKPEKGKPGAVLIVAGPTCSGKSALALALAQRLGGVVINADSMQIYRELRLLTARPGPAETALAPHLLYGVRPAAAPGSVAWWREAALAAIGSARAEGRVPILCGGTGLYFQALREGLSDIPEPGAAARAAARAALRERGPAGLHARLAEVDPESAARLRPTDSQRIARAFEIWLGTGVSLAVWQARRPARAALRTVAILLDPDRAVLRAAIARRFAAMLDEGAQAEVAALLAQGLDPALPAMRAHGVPELAAHLRGEISLAEAAARAIAATGRYTKRQATWFRHHPLADPPETHMIHARFEGFEQLCGEQAANLESFMRNRVDAG